jgi:hypothetical protein
MSTDNFSRYSDSPIGPARAPYAVVPSDDVGLTTIPRGIYVGKGGDVTLCGIDASDDVTYRNLPDASYIAVRVAFVRATGTTASNMIAEA